VADTGFSRPRSYFEGHSARGRLFPKHKLEPVRNHPLPILLDRDNPCPTQLPRALNVCQAGTPSRAFLHNPFVLMTVVTHN
jgi:hypothetical protein